MKVYAQEIPFYCRECNQCKNLEDINENLQMKNDMGYTHDIFCKIRKEDVYRL